MDLAEQVHRLADLIEGEDLTPKNIADDVRVLVDALLEFAAREQGTDRAVAYARAATFLVRGLEVIVSIPAEDDDLFSVYADGVEREM